MFSKDLRIMQNQAFQIRVELFNIANRLNYENPAVSLPNGTAGVPFTDAQAARSATCSDRSTARWAWARRVRRRSRCATRSSFRKSDQSAPTRSNKK